MIFNKENKRVGKRICRIRELRRIKQKDLADMMDFSETHFCNMERGKVNITVSTLQTLSTLLNVPMEQFVIEILDRTSIK